MWRSTLEKTVRVRKYPGDEQNRMETFSSDRREKKKNSGRTGGALSWESLRGDISHIQVRYFLDEGERISRENL